MTRLRSSPSLHLELSRCCHSSSALLLLLVLVIVTATPALTRGAAEALSRDQRSSHAVEPIPTSPWESTLRYQEEVEPKLPAGVHANPPPGELVSDLPCPKITSGKTTTDLSQQLSTRLLIQDTNNKQVLLKASSANCSLVELIVNVPVLIEESVGRNCKNLTIIEMNGPCWDCSWDGWQWLKSWHEMEGHDNKQTANCSQATPDCNNKEGAFKFGIHYQIACLKAECYPCQCAFHYIEIKGGNWLDPPEFLATVDCSNKNLTDEQVPPTLPRNTDNLAFSMNRLKTADRLMEQASKMPHLGVITLINNSLTAVPAILPGHTKNTTLINLANNSITHLMSESFDSYLERSSHLSINVVGNPLSCGCEFYEIASEMKRRGVEGSVLNFISDFLKIRCPDGLLPKLYGDESCPSFEVPGFSSQQLVNAALVILVIANIVFIGLAVDLQLAIFELKQGYSQPRTPRIHVIYMFCADLCKRICASRAGPTRMGGGSSGGGGGFGGGYGSGGVFSVAAARQEQDARLVQHST